MKSITVRGIDKETEIALKKTSERLGKSINATIVTLIKEALGLLKKEQPIRHHELDHLIGTWDEKDVEAFKQATEPFEQIDEELWR